MKHFRWYFQREWSLRQRATLLLAGVSLLATFLIALSLGLVLFPQYKRLETELILEDARRAEQFILFSLKETRQEGSNFVHDVEVMGRLPDGVIPYFQEVFTKDFLENLEMDTASLISPDGLKVQASAGLPMMEEALSGGMAGRLLRKSLETAQPAVGVINYGGLPMVASVTPVAMPDSGGPVCYIFMGRCINADFMEEVLSVTNIRVDLLMPDQITDDGRKGAEICVDNNGTGELVSDFLGLNMRGCLWIRDIDGVPLILLEVRPWLELSRLGLQHLLLLIGLILFFSLLSMAAILAILNRALIEPLTGLTDEVRAVEADGDLARQITVRGHGEIRMLSASMKRMLSRIRSGEKELRRSEARYHAVVEQAPLGIFLATPGELRIVDANEYLCRLTGTPIQSIRGLPLSEMTVEAADYRAAAVSHEPVRLSLTLKNDRGEKIPCSLSLSRIVSGEMAWVCGVVQDLREKRHMEEVVQRAQTVETVAQLAGGVAHDFNNLLMVIIGAIELMKGQEELSMGGKKQLETIGKSVHMASGLVRKLLYYGRQGAIQKSRVDARDLLEGLRDLFESVIPKNISFTITVCDEPAFIEADAIAVEQAVINVALNARDAMPQGGSMKLSVSRVGGSGGSEVVIAVEDAGMGMDEETQRKIFQPFFTTKDKASGSGLGLSVVDGIVKQHGGHIRVRSSRGDGTTMEIVLPESLPGRGPGSGREAALASGVRALNILLVEDQPSLRSLLGVVLRRSGHRVWEAESGDAAIRVAADSDVPPDLLITDVVMPGKLSGFDLAAVLKEKYPPIKMIFISGYNKEMFGDDAGKLESLDDGDSRYLSKPFEISELLRQIESLMEGKKSSG